MQYVGHSNYDLRSKAHSLRCQIGSVKGWIRIYTDRGNMEEVKKLEQKLTMLEQELANCE